MNRFVEAGRTVGPARLLLVASLLASAPRTPSQIHFPRGTTVPRRRPSWTSCGPPPRPGARSSCRRRSASPPSTRTGRSGSSIRCTRRSCTASTGCRPLVKAKPELANVEPFKTVMSGDRAAIAKLPTEDLFKILAATLSGMTTDQFAAEAKAWIASARDPRWKRPYTELTYQPMQELLRVPARQRLQDLHRDRWRAGLRADVLGDRPTAFRRSRWWGPRAAPPTATTRAASRPHQGPEAAAQRQQRRQAGGDPPHDRPPAAARLRQHERRPADARVRRGDAWRPPLAVAAARRCDARIRVRARLAASRTPRSVPSPWPSTASRRRGAGRWSA